MKNTMKVMLLLFSVLLTQPLQGHTRPASPEQGEKLYSFFFFFFFLLSYTRADSSPHAHSVLVKNSKETVELNDHFKI